MFRVPELLADGARTLVQRSAPEKWRSLDGTVRVLGPMNTPFEFLYVMLLVGPDAATRVGSLLGRSGSTTLAGFLVIADLSGHVDRPALLVERLGGDSDLDPAA